jgi:hypothetical protein
LGGTITENTFLQTGTFPLYMIGAPDNSDNGILNISNFSGVSNSPALKVISTNSLGNAIFAINDNSESAIKINQQGTGKGLEVSTSTLSYQSATQSASINGNGISASSTNGIGGFFSSVNSHAIQAQSSSTNPVLMLSGYHASAASVSNLIELRGNYGSTTTAGFGTSMLFKSRDNNATPTIATQARIQALFTDATTGATKSKLQFNTVNNGSEINALALNPDGKIQLPQYTGSNFPANDFRPLGLDASGNILTGNQVATVYKLIDEDITTTPLQTDDELFYNLIAGGIYKIELFLIFNIRDASADAKFALQAPAADYANFYPTSGVYATVPFFTNSTQNVSVAAANIHLIRIDGIIKPTTSGNFFLQWAQQTASATATSILAGSFIKVQKLN